MPEGNSTKTKQSLLAEVESLRAENARLRAKIDEDERFYDVIG